MTVTEAVTEKPVYVGLVAASIVCIILLGVSLVTALLDVRFDLPVSPPILAASAVVFAAVAISRDRD